MAGRYVAPEVYRNEEYDTKVDVFSFALILQEVGPSLSLPHTTEMYILMLLATMHEPLQLGCCILDSEAWTEILFLVFNKPSRDLLFC